MDRYSKKKVPDDPGKRNLKNEAVQEVLPGYEEYLVLLQERNRLLKRLRKKSKKQIDIERKEQGFSIYVNGANTDMVIKKQKGAITAREDRPSSGRLKTAGDVNNKRMLNMEDLTAINIEKQKATERNRAKTAPARERRRNWMAGSVEIKTERGENRRVRAPEMITGNYEDDFEDEDDDDDTDDSEDDRQMRASMSQYLSDNDSDSDIEIDASKHNRFNKFKSTPKSTPKTKSSYSTDVVKKKPKQEEEINEKLELSISDVKKLRQSLCMNANIRESLAKEVSSESDESEIEEIIEYSSQEEELSDRESPIPEEDEDIAEDEDLVPATDSLEENKKAPVFKPTDTIVLELSVPKQQTKVERNLSAARRKEITDESNGYQSRRESHPPSPRGQRSKPDSVLQANVPSRSKQERPLSAHRIKSAEKVDSNEEASAVMAALKAENEKASKVTRNLPTPDKSKPRPSSLNPQRRSVDARRVKTPDERDSQRFNRSKDGPPVRKSVETRESSQGRESKNIPQSPRQESSESFLKNDKLAEIMKKVLLMQPKQQKKLMTVLSKIETTVDNSDNKQKPSTPVKATDPVSSMVSERTQAKRVSPVKSRSPEDMTEVNLELLSTWGNKELIGLTELQFFDKHRKLIPISSTNVMVHGARDNRNLVDVIFNGKGKTNKDRNMWCCKYKKGVPVELCILLPVSSPDLISRVKIWNYNKSIQDLEIGVKHARIFVGGELVFDGNVEKGCGNQVFDYGFIINLNEMEGQPSPRSPKPTSPANVSPPPPKSTHVSSESSRHNVPKSTSPVGQSRTDKSSEVPLKPKFSQQYEAKPLTPIGHSRTERAEEVSSEPKVSQRPLPKLPLHAKSSKTNVSKRTERTVSNSPSPVRTADTSNRASVSKRTVSKSPSPVRPASVSSNSSNEYVQKPSKPVPPPRSETRTMNHSDRNLPKPVVPDRVSPDPGNGPGWWLRNTPTPHSARESTPNKNIKNNRYLILRQSGHVHLPGIVQKPKVQNVQPSVRLVPRHMVVPQPSLVSPRKRKTWQTGEAEISYPMLKRHEGIIKLHRYSDSRFEYGDNQGGWKSQQTVSVFSSQNVTSSGSTSSRKQWNKNKNILLNLASEIKDKENLPRERYPPPKTEHNVLLTSNVNEPVSNGKYTHLNNPHAEKSSGHDVKIFKNQTHFESPSVECDDHCYPVGTKFSNLQYLYKDQFSHVPGAKMTGFLPQIHTNYNTASNMISNVTPRKSWSSPINYYEDPRVFWVNMGIDTDESKLPGRQKGSRTPRKSKRMAAKLDGHSSTETEPKQLSDSADVRSPRVSAQKEEVVTSHTPPEPVPTPKSPPSQQSTLSQSEDDIPMIQKLQQLNQRPQEQSTKKDKPSWLKNEDLAGPFENPPSSRQEQRTPVKNDDHMVQTQHDDIDMLIDEELALWPKAGKSDLKTVFDQEKQEQAKQDGKSTPMQKIKENRSKWRDSQKKNLEESWGSLNMFDRQQKGRISMDLDDDSLDEYLSPPKKQTPKEATIPEEEDIVDAILSEVPGDENFVIPELPYGKNIVIDILSTWGDRHYVGLTGIQVFSSTGEAVPISKITADPDDINVLPEYNKDPRVVVNLIDGVNRTRDDVHMWLAPFTQGKHNYVYLTLDKPCKIALMRIWNYNKSRIHSYRGAKDVIITLDQTEIFKGEIERACGGIEGGTEAFGDTILFTTDENILESVSRNDDAYEGEMFDSDEPDDVPFERPRTADAGEDDDRPFTRAVGNINDGTSSPLPPRPCTSMVTEGDVIVFKGKKLVLNFTATWGDMHYLGLTGLEIVGKDGEALPVTMDCISANPPDLHTLAGHEQDDRTLDKLIDDTNVTMSDEHMWMIPFTEGQNHTLTVDFTQTQLISGLRLWNYNKSREDTYRGARIVHVTIDGKHVSPSEGYLIRKGPGVCHFDYAQEISFAPQPKMPQPTTSRAEHIRKSFSADEASQEYENVQMPCGFIYQLQLITTWGDPYYVGMNGLEFYDAQHNRIELTESNIAAYPDSVNVLEGNSLDVRTPDKLIDGFYDTLDGTHMWVAPILPGILNRIYVIFDQPTTVSMIKLWNYSKTPSRGSKDFALLVDDLLVYNGMLQAVTQGARGIIPGCNAPQRYHTILFTDNKEILRKEKHTVISNQTGDQDIQLTNDKKVVGHYSDPKKADQGKPVNQELRPKTSLVVTKKRR